MIADVILGLNIDTVNWIKKLKEENSDNIFVLDYEYFGESIHTGGVTYISAETGIRMFKNFDSLNFYKSLYVYPGMSGKMSSFY